MKAQIRWPVFLILISLTHAITFAADPDHLEAAWNAFERRQAEAETAEIVWTQTTFRAGEFRRLTPPGMSREVPEALARIPDDVISPPQDRRLLLSGDRVRYEYKMMISRVGEEPEWVFTVDAFDGSHLQTFIKHEWNGFAADAKMQPSETYDSWSMIDNFAIMLLTRPLRPEILGADPEKWRIENRAAIVNGHSCILLFQSTPDRLLRWVYLDPRRDYLPLRYTCEPGGGKLGRGGLTSRVEIQYGTRPTNETLVSWKSMLLTADGQTPVTHTTNKDVEIKLGLPIPKEAFTIDYSPGTNLTIFGQGPEPRKRIRISENGERIPLRLAQAEQTSGGTIRWPWLFAGVGVAALAVALLIWRRRMGAQQS